MRTFSITVLGFSLSRATLSDFDGAIGVGRKRFLAGCQLPILFIIAKTGCAIISWPIGAISLLLELPPGTDLLARGNAVNLDEVASRPVGKARRDELGGRRILKPLAVDGLHHPQANAMALDRHTGNIQHPAKEDGSDAKVKFDIIGAAIIKVGIKVVRIADCGQPIIVNDICCN